MVDYIRCMECQNSRTRVDSYQDVQIVIRDAPSLEQALYRFMEPEQLTGDNRWMCERCGHKVDALKGLRFETAPRLLTMQLKRFDFDWNRGARIKLYNKFAFPFTLDMTPFMPEGSAKHVYDLFAVLVHSGASPSLRTRSTTSDVLCTVRWCARRPLLLLPEVAGQRPVVQVQR